MQKSKSTLLNNQAIKEEITKEIRKYLEINKNENVSIPKFIGCSESTAKKKIYNCKCLC